MSIHASMEAYELYRRFCLNKNRHAEAISSFPQNSQVFISAILMEGVSTAKLFCVARMKWRPIENTSLALAVKCSPQDF